MKKCKVCNIEKNYIDFGKSKRHIDGYISNCKECVAIKRREYYLADHERYKRQNREYYEKNKYDIMKFTDKAKKSNRDKRYRTNNLEKLKEKSKEYYKVNKTDILISRKLYYKKNRDVLTKPSETKRKIKRKSYQKRKHQYAWREILRKTLSQLKLKKTQTTLILLGYDYDTLRLHIANQFVKDMSWDNHGKWHIDHIIPIAKFKKDTPPSIVNCLENLRPLWAAENISKQDKIEEKFVDLINKFKPYII